jgi:uracil-DNA glycosylase
MTVTLPDSWQAALASELSQPYFTNLSAFVDNERATQTVFPPEDKVFNAFQKTPYDAVKVLLLGQDPYHGEGEAHGLSFSVLPGVKHPPSLRNIFKELGEDVGATKPVEGDLTNWATQGVLLLNAVLTVRKDAPASHANQGWETFTDAVIRAVNMRQDSVIFLLWGSYARKKKALIDTTRHTVIESAHPSPLSARSGFFGSRPFSKINAALEKQGKTPINWQL